MAKHKQCFARTKKGYPCPINADRLNDGKPVCHVHDKNGEYRRKLPEMRKIWSREYQQRADDAARARMEQRIREAEEKQRLAHARLR